MVSALVMKQLLVNLCALLHAAVFLLHNVQMCSLRCFHPASEIWVWKNNCFCLQIHKSTRLKTRTTPAQPHKHICSRMTQQVMQIFHWMSTFDPQNRRRRVFQTCLMHYTTVKTFSKYKEATKLIYCETFGKLHVLIPYFPSASLLLPVLKVNWLFEAKNLWVFETESHFSSLSHCSLTNSLIWI